MSAPYLELDLDHEEDIPHKFGERGVGPFAIPFECFIPEKIDGFLPAEKNISQSRMVNGATRLQPHTMLMGQAAGAIAALAIEKGIQPRALDPNRCAKRVARCRLPAHDRCRRRSTRYARVEGPSSWRCCMAGSERPTPVSDHANS
jgi:hypothetical protein